MWDERIERSRLDLRVALLWAFLGVFLLEAFITRLGLRLPDLGLPGARRRARRSGQARIPAGKKAPVERAPEGEVEEPVVEADPLDQRRRRFVRAKRGR